MNLMCRKAVVLLLFIFVFSVVSVSCKGKKGEDIELEIVTVQLGWFHHSQWAGFYAADNNCYYFDEGLKVELIPRAAPGVNVFDIVEDKKIDFGTTNSITILFEKSKNRQIKALSAIYQRDPGVFMTLQESGITRPEDFQGKKINKLNRNSTGIYLRAMMNKVGLDAESVIQIETGYDISKFYRGEVDIWFGFLTNEIIKARNEGYSINVIHPGGYGVNIYGMIIFSTDEVLSKKPVMVKKFLRATLKGWQWAIDNPVEVSTFALEYNPDLDGKHELLTFESSIPLIYSGENKIGSMEADKWNGILDLLKEQNLIEKELNINDAFTNKFINEIYEENP